MEWIRFKISVASPRPEVRYRAPTPEEEQKGGPFDADAAKHLAPGDAFANGIETDLGRFPARFETPVTFTLEAAESGRCAECRDNARVRFMVRSTDQHGMKKWCPTCITERLAIEPPK